MTFYVKKTVKLIFCTLMTINRFKMTAKIQDGRRKMIKVFKIPKMDQNVQHFVKKVAFNSLSTVKYILEVS